MSTRSRLTAVFDFMCADGADGSFPASPSAPVCAVGVRSGEPGTPVAILCIPIIAIPDRVASFLIREFKPLTHELVTKQQV
jgi:hypothetical protein